MLEDVLFVSSPPILGCIHVLESNGSFLAPSIDRNLRWSEIKLRLRITSLQKWRWDHWATAGRDYSGGYPAKMKSWSCWILFKNWRNLTFLNGKKVTDSEYLLPCCLALRCCECGGSNCCSSTVCSLQSGEGGERESMYLNVVSSIGRKKSQGTGAVVELDLT